MPDFIDNKYHFRSSFRPEKCLLVGLGRRSLKRHLPALLQSVEIELAGGCDIDRTAASHLPTGVPFFVDVNAAIATVQPTMAIVATPHHTHFTITETLLRAGVAVLKEKPFALNLDEARRLVQVMESEKGFLRLAVQRQFNEAFKAARVSLPKIGTLRHFDAVYHLNTNAYGDTWRGDQFRAGGGALLDMGYHTLDLTVSYFGMPKMVRAAQVPGRTGSQELPVEESVAAILEYKSGLVGRIFLSRCESRKHESLLVTGTKGILEITSQSMRHFDVNGNELHHFSTPPPTVPEGI